MSLDADQLRRLGLLGDRRPQVVDLGAQLVGFGGVVENHDGAVNRAGGSAETVEVKMDVPDELTSAGGAELARGWQSLAELKAERKDDRAKRDRMKSIPQLTAEAQREFNSFIRERDRQAGHACISSGRALDWSGNGVDAGHYRSVGAASHLRFDERNCHAQSKHDNQYKSGNAVDYRIGLIARIGLAAVEALEADNTPRKWTREELRGIKTKYAARRRALLKQGETA